jgi:hypothetical protein
VKRVIQGAHADVHRDESAQGGREGGQTGGEILGVGQDENVGVEAVALGAQELREMGGARLLLAIHEHLHVDRQPPLDLEPRPHGRGVEQDGGLVVHHPATVEATVRPHAGLEGRRLPVIEASRRLDVVVRV